MEDKKANRNVIVNKLSAGKQLKQVHVRKLSAGSFKTSAKAKGSLRKPKPPLEIKKTHQMKLPLEEERETLKIPDGHSAWCDKDSVLSDEFSKEFDPKAFNIDDDPIEAVISPKTSELPLDNGYDISDNGVEELTHAFLTDFPGNSSKSFFERLELLDNFLENVKEEVKIPKPILKKRAASAVNSREVVKFQSPEQEFHEKFVRPFSAGNNQKSSRYLRINQKDDIVSEDINENDDRTKDPDILMEPVVFGYTSGKKMCVYDDKTEEEKENMCRDLVLNMPPAGDSIEDITEENDDDSMDIPSTLKHFLPYRTTCFSEDVIGVDPSQCLVFLPSLEMLDRPLQTVPPPQKPDEELNYSEKIYPPKKKKKKKIYEHPWRKETVEEWKCRHGTDAVVTPRIQIIANNGELLHESYDGYRGPQVIQKEIQDLENLMKGEGSFDGCVVVQFQAEINQIQDTIQDMLPRMEEIERREEEKRSEKETDIFGMKTFYREHGDVMKQIRHQHRLCVLELSALEEEMKLQDHERHFTKNRRNLQT